EEVVQSLYPNLPRPRLLKLTREIAINNLKDICLEWIWSDASQSNVAEMIRCPDTASILKLRADSRPMILAFWHLGPTTLFPLCAQQLGIPGLIVTEKPPRPSLLKSVPAGIEFCVTNTTPIGCALTLKRALE